MTRKLICHRDLGSVSAKSSWSLFDSNVLLHKFDDSGRYCAICRLDNSIEILNVETIILPRTCVLNVSNVLKNLYCTSIVWCSTSLYILATFVDPLIANETRVVVWDIQTLQQFTDFR